MDTRSMTRHATMRAQQRGVSPAMLDLLLRFGKRTYDHHGGCHTVFDRRARERVHELLGKKAAQLKFSVYAVLCAQDKRVITVGHRRTRMRWQD